MLGFEFLEGRGFDAAADGIGEVCVDRLRHRDPWPWLRYEWFRDSRPGHRRGIGRSGDGRRRIGRHCGAERRQALDERLLKLDAHFFGLGPLSGFGALAKVVSVDLAADPFGAVAAAAGTVSRKSAAGGVAGKDRKQHRAPTSSGEIARGTEVGQRAQRTNYVQNCASILPLEDKLLKISNLELVEAAGVEPDISVENTQLTDS